MPARWCCGILAHCPPGARIVNTAPMSLDEIMTELSAAHAEGKDVARLHSGDSRSGPRWANSCGACAISASPIR